MFRVIRVRTDILQNKKVKITTNVIVHSPALGAILLVNKKWCLIVG